jgi:hypothetical protein
MPEKLRTGPMPGELIPVLDNDVIGSPAFPFAYTDRIFGHVVLPENFHMPGETTKVLIRHTPFHFRNAEVVTGRNGVLWEDEYQNLYSTLTAKGADGQNFRVVRTNRNDLGYMVWGAEHSLGLGRKIIASRILRSAGVDCEVIEALFSPGTLPVDDALFSTHKSDNELSPFAATLLTNMTKNKNRETETVLRGTLEANFKDIAAAFQYLNNVDFVVEYRGTLSPYSLEDLIRSKDKAEFMDRMKRLITVVNLSEKIQFQRGKTDQPEHFDLSDASLFDYFCRYVPKRLALNMALTHNQQIAYRTITYGNVMANGGLKDLEYVVGEEFNDYMNSVIAGDTGLSAIIVSEFVKQILRKGWLKIPQTKNVDFGTIEGYGIAEDIKSMIKAQYDTVYFVNRKNTNGSHCEMDLDYEWYHEMELLEFQLFNGHDVESMITLASDPKKLREDILNAFSRVYGWDFRLRETPNRLDMEQLLGNYLEHLDTLMEKTIVKIQKNGFYAENADLPLPEALLYELYADLNGSEGDSFLMYVLDAIEQYIRESLSKHKDLRLFNSERHKDQIIEALTYLYADREFEWLQEQLETSGFLQMAVTEIIHLQNQLVEQAVDLLQRE